jgi:hypothetical protein
MRELWTEIIDALTSLKLTIVALAAALVLVTAGTFAQVHLGLQVVQEHFFRSLVVWWPVESNGLRIPVFPGGHLIGAVLLLNLIAVHVRRFRFVWRNLGTHLTHGGLIVMLAGALLTDLFSVESSMRLAQGQTKSYSEDVSRSELAVIDTSDPQFDQVTVVPLERLRPGSLISQPNLPFSIAVRRFHPNSRLQMLAQAGAGAVAAATQGQGAQVAVHDVPRATAMNERNLPSAVLEILPTAGAGGQGSLGTWLVSEALGAPQSIACAGKTYTIALRSVRHYNPYRVQLLKFTHERYPGTEIPKNFSSSVLLTDEEKHTSRNVLIYMNHPLRYRGDTYYQAGFDDNDTTSILQVVHNPAVVTPYVGCLAVGAGLLLQFSMHLVGFLRRVRRA